jgi:hypothetical protein
LEDSRMERKTAQSFKDLIVGQQTDQYSIFLILYSLKKITNN